jgi:hypothetical protein
VGLVFTDDFHDEFGTWPIASCAGPLQRDFWVRGVDSLRDYLGSAEQFTMRGRAELIRCPTLITLAEGDPLAVGAQAFVEALRCPKKLIRFAAADGAGDHCEMQNRSRLNRSVLDWLDGVFGCGPRRGRYPPGGATSTRPPSGSSRHSHAWMACTGSGGLNPSSTLSSVQRSVLGTSPAQSAGSCAVTRSTSRSASSCPLRTRSLMMTRGASPGELLKMVRLELFPDACKAVAELARTAFLMDQAVDRDGRGSEIEILREGNTSR